MKKEKWQQLGHLCAGVITIVPGFDAFEGGDYKSAVMYLGVAIFFMVLAGLHKKFVQQFMGGDVAFFLLEAVVIFYSGWQYHNENHEFLYYAMVVTAILYFLFALLSINLEGDVPKNRRRSKRRKRSSSSSSTSPSNERFPSERQRSSE